MYTYSHTLITFGTHKTIDIQFIHITVITAARLREKWGDIIESKRLCGLRPNVIFHLDMEIHGEPVIVLIATIN